MTFRREREMEPMVASWLRERGCIVVDGEVNIWHLCDMYGVRFAKREGRRIPGLELAIAVELKLERFGEALQQAKNNRSGARESWVAMPRDRVQEMQRATLRRCVDVGVGLLLVDESVARSFIGAGRCEIDPEMFDRIRRRLWRRTKKARTS